MLLLILISSIKKLILDKLLILKKNFNNNSQIEQDLENEGDEEEIEMKSDSETGEKVPANNKRRSSTAMFVNYHFLSKQEKNAINNMNNDEMETEESSSFLSKIPIIKEFAGSRRSSNGKFNFKNFYMN